MRRLREDFDACHPSSRSRRRRPRRRCLRRLSRARPAPSGVPEIVAQVQAGEIGTAYSAYRGGRAYHRSYTGPRGGSGT